MNAEAADLLEECAQTKGVLDAMTEAAFAAPTAFKAWTTDDILVHLTSGNRGAVMSLIEPEAFEARMARVRAERQAGASMRHHDRELAGEASGHALAEAWMASCRDLAAAFGAADLSTRVPWGGKMMSARSSISARLMENWAHAQAIYDLLGLERREGDRLRNIAMLGVNTYGWTFESRGLTPPGPPPHVRLTAPSGAVWSFHPEDAANFVRGEAADFCRIVAQTRNVRDTGLEAIGEVARLWMENAQCFAGPAHPPPAPGVRAKAAQVRADLLARRVEA